MACLSYKPNPVMLESGLWVQRMQAVEMQSKVASQLEETKSAQQERLDTLIERFEQINLKIEACKKTVDSENL